jgi:hypothetical protein
MTQRKIAITVHRHDGSSTTTLHLTDADDETKLLQVLDDLGLTIDEDGYTEDDPEIRRITVHNGEGIAHHDHQS